MQTIVLYTNSYPFLHGETYLERELEVWAEQSHCRVIILPFECRGRARAVPDAIDVFRYKRYDNLIADFYRCVKALFKPFIYSEFRALRARGKLNLKGIVRVFLSAIKLERSLVTLNKFKKHHRHHVDLVYCYWNFPYSFAAALAKRQGNCSRLVARVHGGDLYESRFAINYSPFKRQFVNDFDRLYFLAEGGRSYYQARYSADKVDARISPLGVSLPTLNSSVSQAPEDTLRILTIANVIPLKRIDKMLDAVAELAASRHDVKVEWLHAGEGPLREQFMRASAKYETSLTNLKVTWLGQVENSKIHEILAKQSLTCVVNTSESEGMPVSLMEAMSYGIPVVAPDVGSIKEIFDDRSGVLLSSSPSAEAIADAIVSIKERNWDGTMSEAARAQVAESFDATKNYRAFVGELVALAETAKATKQA